MTKPLDLIGIIDQWGEKSPEQPAHISGNRVLTFGELHRQSDALATHLDATLKEDRAPVAVVGHKQPEMLVAFLAIVKTGRAYVPIESSMPEERVRAIIQGSKTSLTLTPTDIAALNLRSSADAPYCRAPIPETAPFYIMFTSGSTGEPKGVVITHRCLAEFVSWMLAEQKFTEGREVFLNQAPFSFDLSVMDLYLSLLTGSTLFSISFDDLHDSQRLHRQLAISEVTVWVSTPSFARMCLSEANFTGERLQTLKRFLFCGEILQPDTARQLLERFPEAAVWNTYGPTEATVAATSIRVTLENIDRYPTLPVGYPMPSGGIAILHEDGERVPEGQSGEIVISGSNVSPGYLNRPDLNQTVFKNFDGQPAYHTGDWGHLADGLLFFEGRRDGQIKHHGYRIELGEIEAHLGRHPAVQQAAALVQDYGTAGSTLVAYLVFSPSQKATRHELRKFLSERLPPYAVPSAYIDVPGLPLTPNGKLDRRALPAPARAHFQDSEELALPDTELQRELVKIWEEHLSVRPIGIRDGFFDLGGDSLLAVQIAAEIERVCRRAVPVAWAFHTPTVETLALHLADAPPVAPPPSIIGLNIEGERQPFFCVCGYFDIARHLGAEQPFYKLDLRRLEKIDDPTSAIERMASQCIEEIRSVQAHGPYHLGGHSLGGVVAFEIARQLAEIGQETRILALMDPDPPKPTAASAIRRAVHHTISYLAHLRRLSPREQWLTLRQSSRSRLTRLQTKLRATLNFAAIERENKAQALEGTYRARPYRGRITLFLAEDETAGVRTQNNPRLEWGEIATGGANVHLIPGDHETLLREPNVRQVARILRDHLETAGKIVASGALMIHELGLF